MDFGWWLQQIIFALLIQCEAIIGTSDPFEAFRPKQDNPNELNEFLSSVLEHRGDFSFVQQAAAKYQKAKKDTQLVNLADLDPWDRSYDVSSNLHDWYKSDKKRHVHNYHNVNKRFHNFYPMRTRTDKKKQHRYRRHVKKRSPEEIRVEPEGVNGEIKREGEKYPSIKQKKDIPFTPTAVHKTLKHLKGRQNYEKNLQNNMFYVDLDEKAEENREKIHDRREYNWGEPKRYLVGRPGFSRIEEDDFNYPLENEGHHVLDDDVDFEQALSYEIEPRYHGDNLNNNNNPQGNNLYSVDEGRPDTIQPFHSQKMYESFKLDQKDDYPQPVTYENFRIENNPRKNEISFVSDAISSPNLVTTKSDDEAKTVKQVGQGFIEISKSKRNDEVVGHNEHYQSRKLQFINEAMMGLNGYYDDYDYPHRVRRDFLDALGMKNEEDYSEDNPYRKDLDTNNTEIKNDTHIHKGEQILSHGCETTITTTEISNTSIQKEDVKDIKQILEEPKEMTGVTAVGSFKTEKQEKRAKRMFTESDYFDDITEGNEVRRARNIEDKILENKNKIYNFQEDQNFAIQTMRPRVVRKPSGWAENNKNNAKNVVKTHHRIDKKEDHELGQEALALLTTTLAVTNSTPLNNGNSTYEQVARQMDLENEKLAQVVNGHLATKIVSTVFDKLKSKLSLKTKFYSGLSRKHVNYAGTIDFDIFKANDSETEDVNEARLLLEQITKVLNRLVLNQVRRRLCQRLPDELKDYLDILLNIKTTLEVTNFVPNTKQGDFLFNYQEDSGPPFDTQKLQEILVKLEGLLLNYHNMNEDCQNRAQPVKDYIDRHVKMLKQMVTCPDHNCGDKINEMKRDTPIFHNEMIEKQLESVGLGKNHDFIPNFDVNQIVRNKLKDNKWQKRETEQQKKNHEWSDKYKKLQLAAEKIREKRENEKKIGELFGKMRRSAADLNVDYEEPVVYSLG